VIPLGPGWLTWPEETAGHPAGGSFRRGGRRNPRGAGVLPGGERSSTYLWRRWTLAGRRIGFVIAGAVLLAGCGSTTPSASSGTATTQSLASLVVTPSGFVSEATDRVGGGQTGTIGISEAASADCDPGSVRQDHWVASELRYFDSSSSYPETYVLLCVTQLSSAADASANEQQVAAMGVTSGVPSVGVTGAEVRVVGPAYQTFFARGRYFVFIVVTDLSGIDAPALAASVAQEQAGRLSG
jgi:hypothetical protein